MDDPWLRHALRYQQSLTREVTTLKGVGWGGVGWGGVVTALVVQSSGSM